MHSFGLPIGWDAPALAKWLELSAEKASQASYGKPACYLGEGGSIPFMGMLGKMFPEAQFLITGVVGPSANAHGPNEFLHVGYAKKLTGCVASVGAPVVTASCLWLHTYLRLCPAC